MAYLGNCIYCAGKSESTLSLVERAGMPSQDRHPDCEDGKVSTTTCRDLRTNDDDLCAEIELYSTHMTSVYTVNMYSGLLSKINWTRLSN